jgi:hypothetical protein
MTEQQTSERITEEVSSWPGVTAGPGTRSDLAFKVGRREIGHLHGDRVAHFGFPKDLWTRLFEQGRIDYHPVSSSASSPVTPSVIRPVPACAAFGSMNSVACASMSQSTSSPTGARAEMGAETGRSPQPRINKRPAAPSGTGQHAHQRSLFASWPTNPRPRTHRLESLQA